MIVYLKLAAAALLPVVASALLYLEEKRGVLKRLPPMLQQALIGAVFGLIAIFGTEFGIANDGYTLNVRDAAPICAGLLFGAPAGIFAGLIGGVERYFAAYWGAGEFTQLACSLGTFLSGLIAGLLRKYVFADKRPTAGISFFYGFAIEILHMLMVYLTNLDESVRAFAVVKASAAPMILATGFSVMLATIVLRTLKRNYKDEEKKPWISQKFQQTMLLLVIISVIATTVFTNRLTEILTERQIAATLTASIDDVKAEIVKASDETLLELAEQIASNVERFNKPTRGQLDFLRRSYGLSEVNLVDADGILTVSTDESNVGYDMSVGEQASEFLVLLDGETTEYVQGFGPISRDSAVYRKYAGHALERGGFVEVGFDADLFYADLAEQVRGITRNHHVGESGSIIICDTNYTIVSDRHGREGEQLSVTGLRLNDGSIKKDTIANTEVYGQTASLIYTYSEGYYIISVLPWEEGYRTMEASTYLLIFMEVLILGALFANVYILIQKQIVDSIEQVNGSLSRITAGELDERVSVHDTREFDALSNDINATVDTLKRYIDEAAARIDQDLALASAIQLSAMPQIFPKRDSYDLWSFMTPAREVGGDFYDFYRLPIRKLAFLIADVSGKGIPAAMFMMTAKSIIKGLAESGNAVQDVFTKANEELCAGNDAGMFITAWMGILDLETGLVRYANAGHNPPLIRRADGSFEYLKGRSGFVLAGMEGVNYKLCELQLNPGDTLFLYTDGVTEATDVDQNLYGEQRLLDHLNTLPQTYSAEQICRSVKADVDAFVGDAPQFDDITMLCLRFHQKEVPT